MNLTRSINKIALSIDNSSGDIQKAFKELHALEGTVKAKKIFSKDVTSIFKNFETIQFLFECKIKDQKLPTETKNQLDLLLWNLERLHGFYKTYDPMDDFANNHYISWTVRTNLAEKSAVKIDECTPIEKEEPIDEVESHLTQSISCLIYGLFPAFPYGDLRDEDDVA